jgi:hypothetical protein
MPILVYFLVLNVNHNITTPLALLPCRQVVSNHVRSRGSWSLLASRRVEKLEVINGEFEFDILFEHLCKSKYLLTSHYLHSSLQIKGLFCID